MSLHNHQNSTLNNMLKISCTTIEKFNKYLHGDCWRCNGKGMVEVKHEFIICPQCEGTGNYSTTEKLIADLKAPWVTNRLMELGTAFHAIMENPDKAIIGKNTVTMNGYEFPLDVISKCYENINSAFPFESYNTIIYVAKGEKIEVVTKCDQLEGLIINEHKTKWGEFKQEEYESSCQWKMYLESFGATAVRFKVFALTDKRPIVLRDIHIFDCYDYPELRLDNLTLVEDFVEFIYDNNLESLYQKKW
jgi:hypothetical protein